MPAHSIAVARFCEPDPAAVYCSTATSGGSMRVADHGCSEPERQPGSDSMAVRRAAAQPLFNHRRSHVGGS